MSFKKVSSQVSLPALEEAILKHWEENQVFKKSVAKNSKDKTFVFYEGPPTANGKPGLHHVLARAFKDVIPRYKTMKGYRVERKAGWDTHGLPVELQVEKALGLKNKQEIENIIPGDKRASIIKFNEECKKSVWEYRDLWEKLTRRMGYFVDMEHPYVTYENEYIESVWWQIAQISKMKAPSGENMLYKGHKVVPYCYRCGTALSSHEVAQGYQTVKDNSVYVKFKVISGQKIKDFITDDNTYIIAWTTTPWTLPGNTALAIRPNTNFSICEMIGENDVTGDAKNEKYIVASELQRIYEEESRVASVVTYAGSDDLVGKKYEPLYPNVVEGKGDICKIILGGFVTLDSGTGIVHIAPAFGEDDANVAKENGLPTLLTVEADGTLAKGFGLPGEGIPVKKKNDKNRFAVDDCIIEDLKTRGLFFKEEVYEHEYPFCWRCDTPLIYFAKPSWFIRMSEWRDVLVANNQNVNWVPEHIKEGRFGEWLAGAKDWAISRERYWGTPLPIWNCEECEKQRVVFSHKELTELSEKTLDDLHKPYIDEVTFLCDCGGTMKRTPEVLDVWFDSGAMPLAQFQYPNTVSKEEKESIETGKFFPADYICEAIDQTRGWFYTLHAIATLLHQGGNVPTGNAYKNVICLGHILDTHGKKMSKSRGNIIDPFQLFDEYGADALRFLLFSLNQPGLPKRFDAKGMRDVQNRVFRMLWNSYSFFMTYASIDGWEPKTTAPLSTHLLDRWILSELQTLLAEVDKNLATYDVYTATKKIEGFIDHLSNWYIRRSRDRFWKNENDADKERAYQTLFDVLVTLVKLMAPFTPFITEEIYRGLTNEESVHLADWPTVNENLIDSALNEEMSHARFIVTMGLKFRAENKQKVRQPLRAITARSLRKELQDIVTDELNVKEYISREDMGELVELDLTLTEELKLEGEMNEINRAIQDGRKKAGLNVEDRIVLGYQGKEKVFEVFGDEIAKKVLATKVAHNTVADATYQESVLIDGEPFSFWIERA